MKPIKKSMNMKHFTLSTLLLIFIATGALAQNSKRTTAYNYMEDGELAKALEYIEPTITHPKTMDDEKTWRYRGRIYAMIASSQNEEYKNLHPNPVKVAAESYMKAMELDERDSYKRENMQALVVIQQQANVMAGNKFAENQFSQSYENFRLAAQLAEKLGVTDTVAVYNAGLAAERGEMYPEAAEQYQKSIDLGYEGGKMYVYLALLYEKMEQPEKYFETVQAGRQAYPGNADLIRMELNHYLQNEKFAEAENNLKLAIEKDPEDKALHFALGVVYDQLGKIEPAAEAYKKAIALDANYFDALYNLGALYFNRAVELNQEANDASDDKVYQEKRDAAADMFVQAEPFLERARAIEPNDQSTLASLRQLYAYTNQTEKYNEVKAIMEGGGE